MADTAPASASPSSSDPTRNRDAEHDRLLDILRRRGELTHTEYAQVLGVSDVQVAQLDGEGKPRTKDGQPVTAPACEDNAQSRKFLESLNPYQG